MRGLALLTCVWVLASVSVTSARTWYITPDGTRDAPTIKAGADSAAYGDTLLLADGAYTGAASKGKEEGVKSTH